MPGQRGRERERCYLNPRIFSVAIFSVPCGHVEITLYGGGHRCWLRVEASAIALRNTQAKVQVFSSATYSCVALNL